MEWDVVERHVNIDFPIGTDESDVLDIAFAQLDDLGIGCDQSREANRRFLPVQMPLFKGKYQIIDKIVFGVELEIIREDEFVASTSTTPT